MRAILGRQPINLAASLYFLLAISLPLLPPTLFTVFISQGLMPFVPTKKWMSWVSLTLYIHWITRYPNSERRYDLNSWILK